MTPKWFDRPLAAGLALVLTAGLCACSTRALLVGEVAGALETGLPAFEGESDLELLERAIPANIKLLEALRVGQPDDPRLPVLLARLYGAYAFAIFDQRVEEAALAQPGTTASAQSARAALNRYYLRGAEYALQALELRHPDARERLSNVAEKQAALEKMTLKDLDALFWYAFNLGAYVNQNRDSMQAIAKAHVAQSGMERVAALDETYDHGGAHLFLMIFYGSRPAMMGGDPERALAHYRRLMALAGEDFLLAHVYHARYELSRLGDRQGYEALLRRVLAYEEADDPYPFLNAVAKERARIYLNAAERFF